MSPKSETDKTDLIDKVVAEAKGRVKGARAKQLSRFIHRYYAHVPPRDIMGERPATLYGAAFAHWKFAATRKSGKPRIRVYNPRLESDGWKSDHTVVEIVNDDMPFLVDSVTAVLNQLDLTVHLVIHPIVHCKRDKEGALVELADKPGPGVVAESFMHLQVTEQSGERLTVIGATVGGVLGDVRASVEDWRNMLGAVGGTIAGIRASHPKNAADELGEVLDFLQWIHDDHFTFLGCRDYEMTRRGKSMTLSAVEGSGQGLLRNLRRDVFGEGDGETMPPLVRDFVGRSDLLFVTKANLRSTVHRSVHLDAIGVKRFDTKGRVSGLQLFVGLFTSAAYNRSPRDIPLLRRKVHQTLARTDFPPASHDGKALLNILETFPRDELFQVSEDHLVKTGLGILHLQERQRVSLFIRRDDFERYVSLLIYIPRDRYSTALREQMQAILERDFAGEMSAFNTELGDSPLVRLHMIIGITAGGIPDYDPETIEEQLLEASRSWTDHLQEALVSAHGEERGQKLLRRYGDAFPSGYEELFGAEVAVLDIDQIERVLESGEVTLNLYRPIEAADSEIRFKIYHPDRPVPLSDVLPMMEHMGLKVVDEIPHAVEPRGARSEMVMIHDFGMETRDGSAVEVGTVRDIFQEAFLKVWHGDVESDGFNALVLLAGLHWREVVILRAYCKYLRQAGILFSQDYMERTLAANPLLTRLIVQLFHARFDPRQAGEEKRAADFRSRLDEGLESVVSADEDRILRRFVNLVDSTLRTNFYQTDDHGAIKPRLSFKFDSSQVEELPLPRPLREIFVYSARVEGVHLRFGMVARGGLRWSDRREDFRTEVLGLVKAQQVKNAVIVPVGSKGGFVVKRPPVGGDREALQKEGIACYQTFVSGMLDITDNLVDGEIAPPETVIRRDDDDPYLVVAADKGTATFSDIANEISDHFGFWLGDAFASGGSQGYDHKKMGITARGAWESVKRHFREMGTDIQSEDFSVVGVGDMSGDVFGNGMLLSRHIKLLGAFNHLHIFIDPEPDPKKSFAERERLFALPRSSWADYDAKLISKGGGVFERAAKTIRLTPQIKTRFDIATDTVTPNELIRTLLGAEVDLLWFGGIGTYVKATAESHADAGDRTSDALRLNGGQLRCRVLGEGANLGVTQRGRIEYALAGGHINTDSIDNSAGVDCSDHEVNIKILLDSVAAAGDLTGKHRNQLLAQMTDEVGDLVLRDNYLQSAAITLARARGDTGFENQIRLMRHLERSGRLDRAVEFLPDEETLMERLAAKLTLTRPECAVLMSYSKIWLNDELMASDLPDDPYLLGDLETYFPSPLQEKFRQAIQDHRLRREIVATRVTNSMVNRAGDTVVTEFMEKTGLPPADIARAYAISREVFAFRSLWAAIEALDNRVPAEIQTSMLMDINTLLEWVTLWFLRNGLRPLDIGAHVKTYAAGMRTLADSLGEALPAHYREDGTRRATPYVDGGVPKDLAMRIAGLVNLFSGCDIVRLANRRNLAVPDVARLYFTAGTRFRLGRLRSAAERLVSHSHWQSLAVTALIEEIYGHQLSLTSHVLDVAGADADPEEAIERWIEANRPTVDRTEQILSEIWAGEIDDLSMIAVASRQLRALTEAPAAAAA